MAWDKNTGDALAKTAHFLKQLRALKSGQRIELHMNDFQDMLFPVHPLARPTWDERADWLRDRVPFRCRWWRKELEAVYVFERAGSDHG